MHTQHMNKYAVEEEFNPALQTFISGRSEMSDNMDRPPDEEAEKEQPYNQHWLDTCKALKKPFPKSAIKRRQGTGRMLDYVTIQTVVTRLNNVMDNDWSFQIQDTTLQEKAVIVTGTLTINSISKSNIGGWPIRYKKGTPIILGLEDTFKSAASDCLKRCATLFGVALDLYGDYEEPEEKPAQKEQQKNRDAFNEVFEQGGEPPPEEAPEEKKKMTPQDYLALPSPNTIDACRKLYQGLMAYLHKEEDARHKWEQINLGRGTDWTWTVERYMKAIALLRWIWKKGGKEFSVASLFLTKSNELISKDNVTWEEILNDLGIQTKSEITHNIIIDSQNWCNKLNTIATKHGIEDYKAVPL